MDEVTEPPSPFETEGERAGGRLGNETGRFEKGPITREGRQKP